MPIDHTHRAIFVHIPKAGGTSMERALGIWTHDNLSEEHPLKLFGRQQQHRTAEEIRDIYVNESVFKGYYKFGFVRNPWDRLVSEFHYLTENKVINFPFDLFASREFLSRTDLPHFVVDHIRPQADYVFDSSGTNLLDFVGYFERMEEDWEKVTQALKITNTLQHLNKKKSDRKPYQELYTEKMRNDVAEHYARDIEAFNYHFE